MLFDSLSYVKILNETGFRQAQSEALIGIWTDVMKEDFVTKSYLSKELKLLEQRMIIKLGGMQVASIVLVVTLFKFLKL